MQTCSQLMVESLIKKLQDPETAAGATRPAARLVLAARFLNRVRDMRDEDLAREIEDKFLASMDMLSLNYTLLEEAVRRLDKREESAG